MKTNRYILVFACVLWCAVGNLFAVEKSYYNSLDGKSGSALREAMTTLLYNKHTTGLGYNWVFDGIDWDSEGNVYDIYSDCGHTKNDETSSYKCCCDAINREHVVPQSTFESQYPQYADRHHLFVVDGKVNGYRSDYAFGECSGGTKGTCSNSSTVKPSEGTKTCSNHEYGKLGTSTFSEVSISDKVYEPKDEFKGDIARAIMYMVVRYATASDCKVKSGSGTGGNSYPVTAWSASSKCGLMFSSSLSTNYGLSAYGKALLMKWHRADPPSAREIARNNGVEAKQGNRNPFIDLPDLAEYLWGTHAGEAVALSSLDIATGSSGGGSSTYQVILNRHGATQTITCTGTYTLPTSSTEVAACEGWPFAGWTTSSSVNTTTEPSFTYSVSTAATLYAVYSNTVSSAPKRAKMVEEEVVYTLTPASGSNNNYANNCDITINGITWNLTGNSTVQPWRIGGKSLSAVDRSLYSKTAIEDNISKIEIKHGGASSITINSMTVIVSANSDFTNPISTLTPTFAANNIVTINRPNGIDWTGKYYKITYNLTVSGTSNKYLEFAEAEFYTEETSSGGGEGTTTTTTYKTSPDCGTEHSVTLSNSGSATGGDFMADVISAYSGATVTLTAYPNEGYSFSSWTVTKAGGGSVTVTDNKFEMPDADVTISASFTEKAKHTIRFYNNGSVISTQSVYQDSEPDVPSNPTACDGYEFVGWWTSTLAANNTTEQDWITDFTVSGAQDYYAVFSHSETSGGGEATWEPVTSAQNDWSGDYVIVNPDQTHAMTSDFKSGTSGEFMGASVTITNNKVVSPTDKMIWTIAKNGSNAQYSFKNKSTGTYAKITGTSSTNAALDANAVWFTIESTNTSGVWDVASVTNSARCFAYYASNTSFRTYAKNSNNTGYLFKKTGAGGSSTTYYTSSPDCSTPQNVTVSFNANGGTGTMANQTITYNTATALTANTFTRTGYTFQGWATSANGEKVYNNSASVTLTENTTLYALWTVNSYTITTNAGTGGSLSTSPSGNANFGETVTITVTPDGTHTVGSVSVKDASNNDVSVSGTGNERTFTMPASNVTVSATFNQKQQYSINFIVDGETISTQNLYEGATAQKPTDPTACEGYTFVGWWTSTLAADNTTAQTWITDFTVSGAQDYYAVFSHTETSGSGGGTPTNVTETGAVASPYVSLTGWSASAGGTYTSSGNYGGSSPSIKFSANDNYVQSETFSGAITSVSYWYKPQNATGSIVFYVSTDGSTFTELTSEKVSFSNSSTSATKSITLSASSGYKAIKLVYSKTTSNVAIDDISVTYGGGGSSSTTYYTSSPDCVTPCSTLATPVVTATPSNGQITLTWADVEGADHYSVTISKGAGYTTECGNAANIGTITGTTTKTCAITGLTNGLTYTTSVVAHATSETCDSEADEDTAIPTECEDWTDPTLTWSAYNLNTTGTNTATCSISGTTHGTRSFESSNTEVLTVASDGTVTAVGAGTATVTVSWTAADGYCEKSIISDAFEVAGPLTISFDAYGGEGTMSDQTVTYKVSTAIKENAFTRTGYTFQGWALTADGLKEYNDKQSVAFTNSLTLYAVWQLNSHEVTFTSSVTGATVTVNGQSSSPQTAEYGSTVTLLITPTEHYIVSALTVSGTSGSVDISGTGNTRTFTMPDEAVTVTLTMVAESQYTATFYNGAETFATVSGYADDDIAAPTGTPTSCDDETFTFIGWVATAQASEVTTCPEILTFPQVMTSGGVSYYALFRRSEGGSGGEASVTFKTASSDNNTEYTTDSDIKTHIVDNYTGIVSFEGSKSYPGKSGVKLGSSSNVGSITLNLSTPITTDKITVVAAKYGNDDGDLKIDVNGNTTFGSALSPASGTLEFTDEEMEISSLTVLTTSKRAYVASISLGGGGTNYYTTTPECAACENQVTITKGTAEHGTFQLSKADGSYDNCKNNVSVTVSNITPDYGYYCSGVTATGSHMHVAVSDPDGSGNYTVAYAKGYSITSTINVVFEPLPTYTIRFIDNGSIISTQTVYEGAKAVKPTDPTPCDGYTFVGWWTAEIDPATATAETWITNFTASADQDYYAVYSYEQSANAPVRRAKMATEEVASVTFNTASTDGTQDKSSSIATELVASASGISAYSGSKVYPATVGIKLGTSSVIGYITLTLSSAATVKEVKVTAKRYGSDTGKLSVTAGETEIGSSQAPPDNVGELTFTVETAVENVSQIKVATSAKRAYIESITVYTETSGGSTTTTTYYTTAQECEAPIVTSAKMLVAEYGGARVALAHDNTNTVAALPLMYFGGNYFCPNKDKNGKSVTAPKADTLTWQVAERTDGYYIMSGGQFLAATANGFTLTDQRFLWSKDGGTRLAYDATTEKFIADQQGELPGITPVNIPTSISLTELKSQRDLTKGNFGTICLPHAVALPFTWGVRVYSIEAKKMNDKDELSGIYIVEETEMLTAGKPYLIEALATNMTMWYPTGAETVTETVPALGLVGNLSTTSVYVPVGCYGISNNQLRRVAAENTATIGQYKAYIDLTDVPVEGVGISMQSMYKVLYTAEGENVATGTEQLFDATGINWNEPVYNILGIRVDRNCTGVLIQNGKKFLVTHPRP